MRCSSALQRLAVARHQRKHRPVGAAIREHLVCWLAGTGFAPNPSCLFSIISAARESSLAPAHMRLQVGAMQHAVGDLHQRLEQQGALLGMLLAQQEQAQQAQQEQQAQREQQEQQEGGAAARAADAMMQQRVQHLTAELEGERRERQRLEGLRAVEVVAGAVRPLVSPAVRPCLWDGQ